MHANLKDSDRDRLHQRLLQYNTQGGGPDPQEDNARTRTDEYASAMPPSVADAHPRTGIGTSAGSGRMLPASFLYLH